MSRILLIGGAGYIGAHTALAFIDRGYEVGVFDNFSAGSRSNIPESCEVFEGDILDNESIFRVLREGWDAVVHLAARKAAGESMVVPEVYAQHNISGTLNIMNGCLANGIHRIILSSSAAVYGEPKYLPIDEAHPANPENYYGYTKLCIEGHLGWYERLKGLAYASLRYFNAAGYNTEGRILEAEKNPSNLIPVVMETAAGMREELQVFGDDFPTRDGTCIRDYIHVDDLAEAHVLAAAYLLEKGESLTVNLGSETGYSVREVLEKSRQISGRKIPARVTERRKGDPAELLASSQLARKLLGWEAKNSDLDTIIASTWNVYNKLH